MRESEVSECVGRCLRPDLSYRFKNYIITRDHFSTRPSTSSERMTVHNRHSPSRTVGPVWSCLASLSQGRSSHSVATVDFASFAFLVSFRRLNNNRVRNITKRRYTDLRIKTTILDQNRAFNTAAISFLVHSPSLASYPSVCQSSPNHRNPPVVPPVPPRHPSALLINSK
jgi:hypothetical protein